jgi:hypothetical protein
MEIEFIKNTFVSDLQKPDLLKKATSVCVPKLEPVLKQEPVIKQEIEGQGSAKPLVRFTVKQLKRRFRHAKVAVSRAKKVKRVKTRFVSQHSQSKLETASEIIPDVRPDHADIVEILEKSIDKQDAKVAKMRKSSEENCKSKFKSSVQTRRAAKLTEEKQLESDPYEFVQEIRTKPPTKYRLIKSAVRSGSDCSLFEID